MDILGIIVFYVFVDYKIFPNGRLIHYRCHGRAGKSQRFSSIHRLDDWMKHGVLLAM